MSKPIILDIECIVCNKSLQKINHDPQEVIRRMGKILNRRSRTPNWSHEEKQYLLELIKLRKDVVVTKSNNGPNFSEEKEVAWNEILRELAAKFGNKFSASSIKKVKTQWQNMKRIAREEISSLGPSTEKYTRQSFEVCNILELVKDGVLKTENENSNETIITTEIEIKAENIDEEMDMSGCSNFANETAKENDNSPSVVVSKGQTQNQFRCEVIQESSESPTSEQDSDNNSAEAPPEPMPIRDTNKTKNASSMTDSPYIEQVTNVNLFHKQLQDFARQTSAEKQIKMESLKEERYIVRAMRETAELNKIIAEQKLKHVLWVKKQEMAMYSGEPGSGAGKGGGGGGAIREAGGAFGKMEAAREEEYFYKKQKEQLHNIKEHLDKEIAFHQDAIKRHEDAIRRHKEQMHTIEKK